MKKVAVSLLFGSLAAGCSELAEDVLVSKEAIDLSGTGTSVQAWEMTYESDGLEIEGYIVTPHAEPDEPLPVMIFNRGGNRDFGAITDEQVAGELSFWAEKGYVVLASQYRGAAGSEGEDEFGGDDVNCVLQLENVAAGLDFADENRMVMYGASRGGMMTYLAIKEGMDVKAAVSNAGVSDLAATFEERGINMHRVLNELVGHPAEEEEAYEARSALYWPEELTDVPLMLIHSETDEAVLPHHSVNLKTELEALGHDVELLIYDDGTHGSPEHFEDYSEKVDEWFRTYLD